MNQPFADLVITYNPSAYYPDLEQTKIWARPISLWLQQQPGTLKRRLERGYRPFQTYWRTQDTRPFQLGLRDQLHYANDPELFPYAKACYQNQRALIYPYGWVVLDADGLLRLGRFD